MAVKRIAEIGIQEESTTISDVKISIWYDNSSWSLQFDEKIKKEEDTNYYKQYILDLKSPVVLT